MPDLLTQPGPAVRRMAVYVYQGTFLKLGRSHSQSGCTTNHPTDNAILSLHCVYSLPSLQVTSATPLPPETLQAVHISLLQMPGHQQHSCAILPAKGTCGPQHLGVATRDSPAASCPYGPLTYELHGDTNCVHVPTSALTPLLSASSSACTWWPSSAQRRAGPCL